MGKSKKSQQRNRRYKEPNRILELKNMISNINKQIGSTANGENRRMISELEDRIIESVDSEQQRENRLKTRQSEQSLRHMCSYIYIYINKIYI